MTTKVIDGKTYESRPMETASGGSVCRGCVANDEARPGHVTDLCRKIGACGNDIYKEVAAAPVVVHRGLNPAAAWPFPKARLSDPLTSHHAALKVKAPPLRVRIEDTLRAHGNFTGTELAHTLNARLNSVTPRFAELAKAGRIKDSGRTRNGEIVWQAV